MQFSNSFQWRWSILCINLQCKLILYVNAIAHASYHFSFGLDLIHGQFMFSYNSITVTLHRLQPFIYQHNVTLVFYIFLLIQKTYLIKLFCCYFFFISVLFIYLLIYYSDVLKTPLKTHQKQRNLCALS